MIEFPSILSYQFYIPSKTKNEFYLALKQIVSNMGGLRIFNNDKNAVKEIIREYFNFVETEYNLDTNFVLRYKISNTENVTIPIINNTTNIKVDKEEYKEYISNRIAISTSSIYDVTDNDVISKMFKSDEVIVRNRLLRVYELPIMIHELSHAVVFHNVYSPFFMFQQSMKTSTHEFLAEYLSHAFLEEYSFNNTQTPFLNIEYYIYHKLFITDRKRLDRLVREIFERGYMTLFEVYKIIEQIDIRKVGSIFSLINTAVANASFLEFRKLSKVLTNDTLLIVGLLDERLFNNLIKKESYISKLFNIETSDYSVLENLAVKLRELFELKDNRIRVKKPVELLYYSDVDHILLPILKEVSSYE